MVRGEADDDGGGSVSEDAVVAEIPVIGRVAGDVRRHDDDVPVAPRADRAGDEVEGVEKGKATRPHVERGDAVLACFRELGEDHRGIEGQGLVHRRGGADEAVDFLPWNPGIREGFSNRGRGESGGGFAHRGVAFRDPGDAFAFPGRQSQARVEVRGGQDRLRNGHAGSGNGDGKGTGHCGRQPAECSRFNRKMNRREDFSAFHSSKTKVPNEPGTWKSGFSVPGWIQLIQSWIVPSGPWENSAR